MAYTNSPPDFSPPDLPTPSRSLWKDPLFWGAMISLGAHGVLWLISPLLPESDRRTEADVQRPVELVELSPIDQNRLPDALTQPPVLPDVADPDFADPDFSSGNLESDPPISFAPIFPTLPPPPPPASSLRPRPWTPFPSRRSPSSPTTSPTPTETPNPSESPVETPNPATEPDENSLTQDNNNSTETDSSTENSETSSNEERGRGEQEPLVDPAAQRRQELEELIAANPELYAYDGNGTTEADVAREWTDWERDIATPWV
ncbi:MAG: hypothetical protein AAFY26_22305, partial [Cyanobacteria bacterium J06638_22]